VIGNIIKKEFKELFTLATILSIVVIAVIFGFVGVMISGMGVQIEEKPVIGVVDADHSDLSNIATSILGEDARIVYNGSSAEEGLERVNKEDGVALLLIPEGFSENIYDAHPGEIEVYWIMRGAGIMDSIPSGTVEMLIRSIDQEISKKLVEDNSSLDPTTTLNPTTRSDTTIFKGKEVVGLSPTQIGGLLTSQSITIPIVIMMLIMMAGGSVISSMGLEKENKTLETLLTLPVRRSHIVIGKIVGSAIVGLIMALIYMVGFRYYMGAFQMSDVNLADFGLTLGAQDYLLVGISLFVALLAGLSLCIVLGIFAKNYRSAQTLTFPITALAIIPMFIIMFKDFDTIPTALRILLFAIPFSHPMMATRALMLDDYVLVISGIAYAAIFAAIAIAIAVWLFNTDILLTGRIRKRRMDSGQS
jgi:ABC-2 type transport system permease protein